MKKTIIAAALAVTSTFAIAQTPIPQVPTPAVGKAAAPVDLMGQNLQMELLEQVIGLRQDVRAAAQSPSSCVYDGKPFSEGAIQQVGKVSLVCVERNWGIHISSPERSESRELVWEPLDSDRIAGYRKITHLSSK